MSPNPSQNVKKNQKKSIEKLINKTVNARLDKKMANIVKSSATEFRKEFKKQTLTGITGAFAFLIALTWRTPIQKSVENLIVKLGLSGQEIYYEYIAAILITIIGVVVLIFISRWAIDSK